MELQQPPRPFRLLPHMATPAADAASRYWSIAKALVSMFPGFYMAVDKLALLWAVLWTLVINTRRKYGECERAWGELHVLLYRTAAVYVRYGRSLGGWEGEWSRANASCFRLQHVFSRVTARCWEDYIVWNNRASIGMGLHVGHREGSSALDLSSWPKMVVISRWMMDEGIQKNPDHSG